MILHQSQTTERPPLLVWNRCASLSEALPTRTRDLAPQKVWVHVEGFVTKKQPKPVSSDRELSPPQVLCAEFF